MALAKQPEQVISDHYAGGLLPDECEPANTKRRRNRQASWIGDEFVGGAMVRAYYSSRVICLVYWFANKFVTDPRLIYREESGTVRVNGSKRMVGSQSIND